VIKAPIPADEAERIADLQALSILDTPSELRFDHIVNLMARVFDAPIAYIAMVDSDRQWFKAKCGLTVDQTGRDVSFCGHAILQKTPLIVPDATRDERFHDNPLVVGEPYVRFYAGHPLTGPGGYNVGTLCVAGPEPRVLSGRDKEILRQFAALTEHELQMVDLIRMQRDLIDAKNGLIKTQEQLSKELDEAREYVTSLLPPRMEYPVRTDWFFATSSQLGGDLFGYHLLDDRRLAIYLYDVSGHGVGASLLSISVLNTLRRQTLPQTRFDEPSEVLAGLNRAFPMDEHNDKFLTIWYGVYDLDSRTMRCSSAGHPPAIAIGSNGVQPVELGKPGIVIGVTPDAAFKTITKRLSPGSRVYVFSDGVYEVERDDGHILGVDGLIDMLVAERNACGSRVQRIFRQVHAMHGPRGLFDDFSLLEIETP
jgi:sigma-B regulation protein RsbU (phosphoserine phosphatase)